MIGFGLTALISVTLMIYAFITWRDFTTMGGILLSIFVGLFIFGLFLWLIPVDRKNRILVIIISSLYIILFGFFLIYDI